MANCVFRRVLTAILLAITVSAGAADAPPAPVAAKAGPVKVRSGAYLTSLYDLNANNNTFTADVWLWFLHDKGRDLKPLKTLEPVNARDFKTSLDTSQEHGAEQYHTEKVRGVFNHNWDVKNFPFDRHELKIRLEEGIADINEFVFAADVANTGFDPAILIDGWRIDRVTVKADQHTYNSSFGLSDSAKSTYAASIISIFIERDAVGLFWKLLAAVYIAFLVSIVSYFMDPSKDGIFNGRVGLLVGMIFAVVINSQRVAATLGQSSSFTLADKIHVLTLLSILLTLIGALVSRHLHTTNRGEYAVRIDRRMAAGIALAYALVNLWMIASATQVA